MEITRKLTLLYTYSTILSQISSCFRACNSYEVKLRVTDINRIIFKNSPRAKNTYKTLSVLCKQIILADLFHEFCLYITFY
jgi:hypothetical protein